MDVRRKFFIQGLVRHWNLLPGKAVDAPFLQVSKAGLNGVLANQIYLAGEVGAR